MIRGTAVVVHATPGEEGVEALYRRLRAPIVRYLERQFGAGPPDPDDAVQAAFESYAHLPNRALIENPEAFLRRSAHNFAVAAVRKENVRRRYTQAEQHSTPGADILDASRILESRQQLEVLNAAILKMDTRRRDVLIMHRIHNFSSAEIARRLGCSASLVKLRLAEALAICNKTMRDADGDN